tara:strand:- start:590 stop:1078 length:489 start_codon:yes stop_codon:yes gene_type:complete
MQLYLIKYETENAEEVCKIIAAPSIAEAINITENPPNDFYNCNDKVKGVIELSPHTNQIISSMLDEIDNYTFIKENNQYNRYKSLCRQYELKVKPLKRDMSEYESGRQYAVDDTMLPLITQTRNIDRYWKEQEIINEYNTYIKHPETNEPIKRGELRDNYNK